MNILKNRVVQVVGIVAVMAFLTGAVVDRRVTLWGKSDTGAPGLLGSNYSTGPGATAENTSTGYGLQALSKSGVTVRGEQDGTSATAVPVVAEFASRPSVTTGNGAGAAVNLKGQMAAGNEVIVGGLSAVLDDVSAQKGHLAIMVSDATGAREIARFTANGNVGTGTLPTWQTFSWSNAQLVALDPTAALTTANLKLATFPAGTYVSRAMIDVLTGGTGVDSETVSLGVAGTPYTDFVLAGNAATPAVYGDAKAEMGTALDDVDGYTCTAACDVYAQFIITGSGKHISDVLTSTGKVALMVSQAY
jgi:hypothetical protein